MKKLTKDDLYTLEKYATVRVDFRQQAITHKANRRIDLGEHVSLYFEDRLTMHYQIQEILRAEKIFEPDGIQEEIDAYNDLIPDGSNLKATLMIQYEDVDERKHALTKLIGIETQIWLKVEGHGKVFPVADEDLERETEEKTSAVHFLRFEFADQMIRDLQRGHALLAGVDHAELTVVLNPVADNTRQALQADFD